MPRTLLHRPESSLNDAALKFFNLNRLILNNSCNELKRFPLRD